MPVPVPILTFSEFLVISAWLSAGHVLGCLIDHLPEYESSRLTLLTSDPKNRVNLLRNLREQQETGIFVLFLDLEVYCLYYYQVTAG